MKLVKFIEKYSKIIGENDFIFNRHHLYVIDNLMNVYNGNTNNLLINLSTKTPTTSLLNLYTLWSITEQPCNRTIKVHYCSSLSASSFNFIKDISETKEFIQDFPNLKLKQITKNNTRLIIYSNNKQTGELLCTCSLSNLVETRAGYCKDDYSGCLILDCPQNPSYIENELYQKRINLYFDDILMGRRAKTNTPIIMMSPMLHNNDLSNHLLNNYPFIHVKITAKSHKIKYYEQNN